MENKDRCQRAVVMPELIHSAARPLPAPKHSKKKREREWRAICRRWTLWETGPGRSRCTDGQRVWRMEKVCGSSPALKLPLWAQCCIIHGPSGRPARLPTHHGTPWHTMDE